MSEEKRHDEQQEPLASQPAVNTQPPSTQEDKTQQDDKQEVKKPSVLGRIGKVLRFCLSAALSIVMFTLLMVLVVFVFCQTQKGQEHMVVMLNRLLASAGVELLEVKGFLPLNSKASVRFFDGQGTWLLVQDAALRLDFEQVPERLLLHIDVQKGEFTRLPLSNDTQEEPEEPTKALVPTIQDSLDLAVTANQYIPSFMIGVQVNLAVHEFRLARDVYEQEWYRLPTQQSEETTAANKAQQEATSEATLARKDLEREAAQILCSLSGHIVVQPHAQTNWQDPILSSSVTLKLLPQELTQKAKQALHAQAANTPLSDQATAALTQKAQSVHKQKTEQKTSPAPLQTLLVFTELGIDQAQLQLDLTGSLAKPQLDLSLALGALSYIDQVFTSPRLRVHIPEHTLAAFHAGQKGHVQVAFDATYAKTQDISVALELGASVQEEGIGLSLDAFNILAPGLTCQANLATTLAAKEGELVLLSAQDKQPIYTLLPILQGSIELRLSDFALLAQMLPNFAAQGSCNLALNFAEQAQKQHITLAVTGKNLAVQQAGKMLCQLKGADIQTQLVGLDPKAQGDIQLTLTQLAVPGFKGSKIQFIAKGGLEKGLDVTVHADGDVRARLASHVDLQKARLASLDVLYTPLACGIRLQKPATISYGERFSIDTFNVQLVPGGNLSLAGAYSAQGITLQGKLSALHLDTWQKLVSALPKGRIDAEFAVSGTPRTPKGKLQVTVTDLHAPVEGLEPVSLRLDSTLRSTGGTHALVDAKVSLDQKTMQALGSNNFVCTLSVPLQTSDNAISLAPNAQLKGAIDVAGNVAKLWKLARQSDRRLTGDFRVQANVSGSLQKPVVKGNVALTQAEFVDVLLGIGVRDIAMTANIDLPGDINRGRVSFDLQAKDHRKGTITLAGQSDMLVQKLNLTGTIANFSPLRRRDIRMRLSGNIAVSGSATDPKVSGLINVDRGRIRLEALSIPASVTTLPLSEGPKEKLVSAVLAKRPKPPKDGKRPVAPVPQAKGLGSLDLRVRMPGKFFVNGYGLDSEWKADLAITGSLDNPNISGQVKAVRGVLNLLNRRFEMREGEANFVGGVKPLLNIKMVNQIDTIEAILNVSGSVDKPSLSFSSTPSMPRQDIISYMLFGKPNNELSQFELLRLGVAAAQLATLGSSGGGITDFAKNMVGLDVLNVSQSDGSTRLEMGSYVMDKIYVGLEQGSGESDSDTTAVIQVELGPRTSATMKTDGGDTSIGLNWKLDY